jgi:hypothetical protein
MRDEATVLMMYARSLKDTPFGLPSIEGVRMSLGAVDDPKKDKPQPVPPDRPRKPPVETPPDQPGIPPGEPDPRPKGDPQPNEPTRLV